MASSKRATGELTGWAVEKLILIVQVQKVQPMVTGSVQHESPSQVDMDMHDQLKGKMAQVCMQRACCNAERFVPADTQYFFVWVVPYCHSMVKGLLL